MPESAIVAIVSKPYALRRIPTPRAIYHALEIPQNLAAVQTFSLSIVAQRRHHRFSKIRTDTNTLVVTPMIPTIVLSLTPSIIVKARAQ